MRKEEIKTACIKRFKDPIADKTERGAAFIEGAEMVLEYFKQYNKELLEENERLKSLQETMVSRGMDIERFNHESFSLISDLRDQLQESQQMNERLVEGIKEAKLQLEYLNGKYTITGTSIAVLSRLNLLLSSTNQSTTQEKGETQELERKVVEAYNIDCEFCGEKHTCKMEVFEIKNGSGQIKFSPCSKCNKTPDISKYTTTQ